MRTQITIAAQPEGLGGSNPHRSSGQSDVRASLSRIAGNPRIGAGFVQTGTGERGRVRNNVATGANFSLFAGEPGPFTG
jgi:hypothetical protein